MAARFTVGIDLGTTNSVISYVELDTREPAAQVKPVPQLVDRATVEARDALPSPFTCWRRQYGLGAGSLRVGTFSGTGRVTESLAVCFAVACLPGRQGVTPVCRRAGHAHRFGARPRIKARWRHGQRGIRATAGQMRGHQFPASFPSGTDGCRA